MAETKMDFSERLRLARKRKKLTQRELAEIAGVSRTTLGNYELKKRTPSIDIASRITKALGVDANWLYGDVLDSTYYDGRDVDECMGTPEWNGNTTTASRPYKCPICNGIGHINPEQIGLHGSSTIMRCPTCNGERILWG